MLAVLAALAIFRGALTAFSAVPILTTADEITDASFL
jgi:hypothetical protein